MNQNKSSYNKIANQWAENRDVSALSKLVVDFASKIKTNGTVLDIGCGSGFPITSFLSEKGFSVTGIEIAENMLQKAVERKIPNANLYLCDFFDFEPTEKYDGIIAFDSFFHFPADWQREIYSRVAQWINPGGYLLFTHGNKEGEKQGEMYGQSFYYSCLDTREVHELLNKNGFEVVLSLENYSEQDIDRDLVVLARKIE